MLNKRDHSEQPNSGAPDYWSWLDKHIERIEAAADREATWRAMARDGAALTVADPAKHGRFVSDATGLAREFTALTDAQIGAHIFTAFQTPPNDEPRVVERPEADDDDPNLPKLYFSTFEVSQGKTDEEKLEKLAGISRRWAAKAPSLRALDDRLFEVAECAGLTDRIEYERINQVIADAVRGTSTIPATGKEVDPVDLWARFDPPELPIGLLPETIEHFAVRHAATMGADPAFLAMSAMTVCTAAIPDRIKLRVKRHDNTWLESARLWVAGIAGPSGKKSPTMDAAERPLKRIDRELFRRYCEARALYDALPAAERKTATPPKQVRCVLGDTTMEAAQEVLMHSPDGVLCSQDELSGFFGALDKYSGAKASAKDRAFWLQAFNGGSYAVNRVGRGASLIDNLSISLLGGIQPDPIRKLAAEGVDDGLLQRLCPIVLRPATEGRDEPCGPHVELYEELVERLHNLEPPAVGGPGNLADMPATLRFDDGAQALRQSLERKHLGLMSCETFNKKLAAHIGKYDGIFARLCVVWHCIENVDDLTPIVSEDTARRIAEFMRRFLLPHALSFYAGVLGLSDDHDRLTAVAGYILARKLEEVTVRDVQRGDGPMRGLERRDIEAIFDQFQAFGWGTRAAGPRPSSPARLIVNPGVHARFAERAAREAERREKGREMIRQLVGSATDET